MSVFEFSDTWKGTFKGKTQAGRLLKVAILLVNTKQYNKAVVGGTK